MVFAQIDLSTRGQGRSSVMWPKAAVAWKTTLDRYFSWNSLDNEARQLGAAMSFMSSRHPHRRVRPLLQELSMHRETLERSDMRGA